MGNFITGAEIEIATAKSAAAVQAILSRNTAASGDSDGHEVFWGTVDDHGFDLAIPRREIRGFRAEQAARLRGSFQDLGPSGGRLIVRVAHTRVYLIMCVVVFVAVFGALAGIGFVRDDPMARLCMCASLLMPFLMQWRFQGDVRRGREALEKLLC